MSNQISTNCYAAYGAYELKATYQRNMLYAIATTTATVGLVLLSAFVWSLLTPAPLLLPVVIDGDGGGGGRIKLEEIIIIRPDDGGPKHSYVDIDGVIPPPVIVDDSLIDETSIVSYDTPAEYGPGDADHKTDESGSGFDNGIGGGDQFGINGGGDFLPLHDAFQAVEIYPQMVYHHIGDYPRLERQAGIEGIVYVKVLVDEEGIVMQVMLARSSGVDGLDKAALEWAADCRFSPGIQNGRTVKVWVLFKYNFSLDE